MAGTLPNIEMRDILMQTEIAIALYAASQNPNQLANMLPECRKAVSLILAVPRPPRDNDKGWSKKDNVLSQTSLLPNESRNIHVGTVQKGRDGKGRKEKRWEGKARKSNKGEYRKSIMYL